MLRLVSSKAAQWIASSAPHTSKATRTLSAKTKFDLPDPACELSSRKPLPLSKMVSTIGPTSEQLEPLTKVVKQGMNVMRLNFSHATTEEVELRLTNLEQAEKALTSRQAPEVQQIRALLLDTRGPEIRTGKLKNDHSGKETVQLEKGERITLHTSLTVQEEGSTSSDLFIDYPMLHKALNPGMKVLLDDGAVILTVVEVESAKEFYGTVTCTIDNSGEIRSRAGVNLPMAETVLPALSEKDKADIKYGMSKDIDYVAASFVQTGEGVRDIRRYIKECAEELGFAPHDPLPQIISKIESASALNHFDEILEESDGIMVARGDLGVEIPLQQVTNAQKEMVTACNIVGKPVIVATQMLESMAKNPRPTRAEVADVSNAVYDGADAVMTSGETAKGKYPVETVKMMKEIIIGAEGYSQSNSLGSPRTKTQRKFEGPKNSPEAAIARGAVAASIEQNSAAIVVLSEKYELPQLVSACRPEVPVFAFCSTSKMARLLMLRRAIHPIVGLSDVESDKKAETAIETLKNMGLLYSGDSVVLVSSDDEKLGHTDTLKIVSVP